MNNQSILCPCGNANKEYTDCCARYLNGREDAATAEVLMRSRYTAYTLENEDYLLATWHPSTRPDSLKLADGPHKKWLGLRVSRHEQTGENHSVVEFVARYKVGGRAHRLHEISRFVREGGRWFYVDGETSPATG
jgi:SEC-C motif-containing protein